MQFLPLSIKVVYYTDWVFMPNNLSNSGMKPLSTQWMILLLHSWIWIACIFLRIFDLGSPVIFVYFLFLFTVLMIPYLVLVSGAYGLSKMSLFVLLSFLFLRTVWTSFLLCFHYIFGRKFTPRCGKHYKKIYHKDWDWNSNKKKIFQQKFARLALVPAGHKWIFEKLTSMLLSY